MITDLTPQALKDFAAAVAAQYNGGFIRAPVHLDGGNEVELVKVFKNIHRDDWVCGSWRMMSKCLLKGVPPDELFVSVMRGKSISLCYPEHRVISSAIVAGIVPIAVGLAMGIVRNGTDNKVWCFVGDMTASTGVYNECLRYAAGHDLPIRIVVEDNGKSVGTPTHEVWGGRSFSEPEVVGHDDAPNSIDRSLRYDLAWPHSGAGQRINF